MTSKVVTTSGRTTNLKKGDLTTYKDFGFYYIVLSEPIFVGEGKWIWIRAQALVWKRGVVGVPTFLDECEFNGHTILSQKTLDEPLKPATL